MDKNIQEQNKTDIQAICDKYQVAYWDYFAMPLNLDCFYNCDHLNEKGAVIVSRDVDSRLKALMGEK